jgi:hypothetical protein
MLRHYVNGSCDDWDEYLSSAEFAVNIAVNETTGHTPFFLMYGEQPPTPIVAGVLPAGLTKADNVANAVHSALTNAKRSIEAAQNQARAHANKHWRDVEFEVGDLVLLSTKNLKLRVRQDTKLLPRFVGPLRILARVNPVAYKLELPPTWRVHGVFHVSLLKKHVARGERGFIAAPPVDWLADGEPLYEVESILDHHDTSLRGKPLRRYLIKWKHYGHEHNSWEREANLVNCSEALGTYWEQVRARELSTRSTTSKR